MSEQPTPVAIAIIARDGRYLIRQRPALAGSPMPGYWEFPGGKCHEGEAPAACAVREVLEEAGIAIKVVGLRRMVRHRYPHGYVELSFFDCETLDPQIEPAPETGFRWVRGCDLPGYTFPGANDVIVAELAAADSAP